MLLRNVIRALVKYFRVFQKGMLYIGITFLFGTVLFVIKRFIETPEFLIVIKEQMIENPAFMSRIGEYDGYTIWFDEEIAKSRGSVPFSVSVNGKSDSVYVKITGAYVNRYDGGIDYIKKDTIFSKQIGQTSD